MAFSTSPATPQGLELGHLSPSPLKAHLLELVSGAEETPDCKKEILSFELRKSVKVRIVWKRCSEMYEGAEAGKPEGHFLEILDDEDRNLGHIALNPPEGLVFVTKITPVHLSGAHYALVQAETGGTGSTQKWCVLDATEKGVRCMRVAAGVESAAKSLRRKQENFGCNVWRLVPCSPHEGLCIQENLIDGLSEGRDCKFGTTAVVRVGLIPVKGQLVVRAAVRLPRPE